MTEENAVRYAAIRERDIDLLLCVTAASMPTVWRLFHNTKDAPRTEHSVSTQTGEIDIVMRWDDLEVHVENKIDAEFQPEQPQRYRERSDASMRRTETVLLAPEAYIEAHQVEAEEFHRCVSYEALELQLRRHDSLLATELAEVVRHAIDQLRRGRIGVVSEPRTEFFDHFAQRSKQAGLPFVETGNRGPKSAFFYAHSWDTVQGRKVEVVAKFGKHRNVCVQVSNAPDVLQAMSALVDSDPALSVRATATGTLVIQREATFLDPDSPAGDQDVEIAEFLQSAVRLLDWWRDEGKPFLEQLLANRK